MATPGSDYFGDTSVLEDPDEYRSANTFIVPVDARWSRIASEVRGRDDVKVELDRILKVMEDAYPDRLRGLLPPIYGGSNMAAHDLRALIDLFSKDVFSHGHGEDVIGRVYEYFIGAFASSEGKRGGEFFTPASIVRTLVALLEPERGTVYDPCCGSGGMFVQSDQFTEHSGRLSFYGQESKDFTWRLCRMNLFIHGIDGKIEMSDTYFADRHPTLKAAYVIANPPFNDGSKSEKGWGADRIPDKDPRLNIQVTDKDGRKTKPTLSAKNANTMDSPLLHHLAEAAWPASSWRPASYPAANSPAGGAARSSTRLRIACPAPVSFSNTQIPAWFLSKSRDGSNGTRRRKGEVLFIDGQPTLIPAQEAEAVHAVRSSASWRSTDLQAHGRPEEVPGFCKVTTLTDIATSIRADFGRHVGTPVEDDEDELSRAVSEAVRASTWVV